MLSVSRHAPGLIGVGILWILANSMTNSWVEKDLTGRAMAAIPADTLDKPGIAVSGRDVTVLGTAFSATAADLAKAAVNASSGVRLVHGATANLAAAKPYLFAATREGNNIVLTGNVPDPASRARILAAAKLAVPAGGITDQMGYAAGAPPAFAAETDFAVKQLANFSKGSSALSDNVYSLSGQAASQAGFDTGNAALKKLVDGMTLGKAEILPSAEQIAAADKAAADAVAKLAADKAAADAAAKQAADKAAADAAAKLAADKAAADAAAKQAADKAAADAVAKQAADKAATDGSAVAAASGTDVNAGLLDSKACQSRLNAQLLEDTIEFQTGKAELVSKSEKFLDLLVKTGQRCPKSRIEIAGFTDSVGLPENNIALSSRRAEAVMQYLVKAGLDAGLLSAKGYGEANPVAPNDTPEGRAKNRRIEFNVQD